MEGPAALGHGLLQLEIGVGVGHSTIAFILQVYFEHTVDLTAILSSAAEECGDSENPKAFECRHAFHSEQGMGVRVELDVLPETAPSHSGYGLMLHSDVKITFLKNVGYVGAMCIVVVNWERHRGQPGGGLAAQTCSRLPSGSVLVLVCMPPHLMWESVIQGLRVPDHQVVRISGILHGAGGVPLFPVDLKTIEWAHALSTHLGISSASAKGAYGNVTEAFSSEFVALQPVPCRGKVGIQLRIPKAAGPSDLRPGSGLHWD